MVTFKSVAEVADWRLCLGCGACAFVCPRQNIQMEDRPSEGIRPVLKAGGCEDCHECMQVCPGVETDFSLFQEGRGESSLRETCGEVLEIWEGHASDPEVRFFGSSGGLITALSLYCLEKESMAGVLHVTGDGDDPLKNKTTLSRSRAELLRGTGSRYAPASVCSDLQKVAEAPAPCVIVGQPSEIAALRKTQKVSGKLDGKVGVAISFFCAGSPSSQGTVDLLKHCGINPQQVESLRYRGEGWPGMFSVRLKGSGEKKPLMTYQESWGFLQAYRPLATHLWPDGTGEAADITCGDPWYRPVEKGEAGSSLVVVRTETGRRIVEGAIRAGYVQLTQAGPEKLLVSQRNLVNKRGAIWGRVAALRALGIPTPRYRGVPLFRSWWKLSLRSKIKSFGGTWRRALKRKYFRPLNLQKQKA